MSLRQRPGSKAQLCAPQGSSHARPMPPSCCVPGQMTETLSSNPVSTGDDPRRRSAQIPIPSQPFWPAVIPSTDDLGPQVKESKCGWAETLEPRSCPAAHTPTRRVLLRHSAPSSRSGPSASIQSPSRCLEKKPLSPGAHLPLDPRPRPCPGPAPTPSSIANCRNTTRGNVLEALS